MPRLKQCSFPGCYIATPNTRCEQHAKPDRYGGTTTDHGPYLTRRWRRLRLLYLKRNPWCKHKGCKAPAVDVDHIVPLSDDGETWEMTNLQGLCKRHHRHKTFGDEWKRPEWAEWGVS